MRRRDVIWVPSGVPQATSTEPNEPSHSSLDHEDTMVSIPIPPLGSNPHIEESPEHPHGVEEISDRDEPDVDPTGQIPPVDATPTGPESGDPDILPERLRHSTRNERKDYRQLHQKGFAKLARAAALMDGFDEPLTYEQAVGGPEKQQWLQAMQSEWDSLKSNKTWKLVYPPPNRSVLKGRWVFKKKLGVDGKVARYKARWVVKGFLQR